MQPDLSPRTSPILAITILMALPSSILADWPQYGGPRQDFHVDQARIRTDWGTEQPRELWRRDLGEGFSSVSAAGGFLYTMDRRADREGVLCLNAATGDLVWEHRYDTTLPDPYYEQFGKGPRVTPLIDGATVYAIGVSGVMHALSAKTGEVRWQRDLWKDFAATPMPYGYSSNPVLYKNSLVVLLGGADNAVVALDRETGATIWRRHAFDNAYSTPRLISVDGLDHLVAVFNEEIVGLDPATGDMHWTCSHTNDDKSFENIAMPAVGPDNLLFFSSPKREARTLRLTRQGDRITFSEVWTSRKIRTFHSSTIRHGDFLYGSSGITGPGFLFCANAVSGELPWRERGFATAKMLYADGHLIILDEEGVLAIATPRDTGLTVHARWPLLSSRAWTIPTLVESTLLVRGKDFLVALDIGPPNP